MNTSSIPILRHADAPGAIDWLCRVTQATLLTVPDPDLVHARARAAGAVIVDEPADTPFGGRPFPCRDPEGHAWVFSNHDPWSRPWEQEVAR